MSESAGLLQEGRGRNSRSYTHGDHCLKTRSPRDSGYVRLFCHTLYRQPELEGKHSLTNKCSSASCASITLVYDSVQSPSPMALQAVPFFFYLLTVRCKGRHAVSRYRPSPSSHTYLLAFHDTVPRNAAFCHSNGKSRARTAVIHMSLSISMSLFFF